MSAKPPANPAPAAAPANAQNHCHYLPAPPVPAGPTEPTAPNADEPSHPHQTPAPHRQPRPMLARPSSTRRPSPTEMVAAPSENTPTREWPPRARRGESSRIAYAGTAAFGCPPGEARDCKRLHTAEGFTEVSQTPPHLTSPTRPTAGMMSTATGEVLL